jgi:tetratricopeptide (TPR) repeat protein
LLSLTKGYAAPETSEAVRDAAALAEKSGNLTQIVTWVTGRGIAALLSGTLPAAGTLLNQALVLALREGSPSSLGIVHMAQILTRYYRGDLAGAEEHFASGLRFFEDPSLRQLPGIALTAFAYASWCAWTLGRADLARERCAKMMATVDENNPYDVAFSGYCTAYLRFYLREHEQAEASAVRSLELSKKYQFPQIAAYSRCILGQTLAQLGRAVEGIELLCQGIHDLLEVGSPLGIGNFRTYLAAAQEREGDIVEALETIEQALQSNPDELAYRPETLRVRGQLRYRQGLTEQAEADFRDAIALAHNMGAKARELRGTLSLAPLLERQGRRVEARAMLDEIYNSFIEGFDIADMKDARALLNELAD